MHQPNVVSGLNPSSLPPGQLAATAQGYAGGDPSRETILTWFDRQVEAHRDEIAITYLGETVSYGSLEERANQLAHGLKQKGVSPQSLVTLYLDRTPEMVVAILAVLKVGAAYVPIDLASPRDRIGFILEDAHSSLLMTDQDLETKGLNYSGPMLHVTLERDSIDCQPREFTPPNLEAQDPAYVIYTSGSTGKPKGVLVTHHNVTRLFSSTQPWFHFSHRDVWTLFHSYAFDFSVWEIFGALLHGGRLVIVPYLVSRSPEQFCSLLSSEQVTVLNQTPSAFRQLIWSESVHGAKPLSLRYVIFGGEELELQSLKPWFQKHGDQHPRLINMYGITETTVHVTYRPITQEDVENQLGSVIGQPIPDLTLHLLDEQRNPVPVGTPGEIYVGGAGVARGYLNRPELNLEKFVPNPFGTGAGDRLYRSGDLARALPNGDMEYLGRIDLQVKIRGFRIELGEIESCLHRHPAIRDCVVLATEARSQEKQLVAFCVAKDHRIATSELRTFLQQSLPTYMVPALFTWLETIPLTINGKVDRQTLPLPSQVRPELTTEWVEPKTAEEKVLAEIWEEALEVHPVGIHDNFFELGGDSIRSIEVLAKAQEKGIHLKLENLFETPTIHQLLLHSFASSGETVVMELEPFALISLEDHRRIPPGVQDAYPMSALQKGMVYHSDLNPQSAIFHDVFSFRLSVGFQEDLLRKAVERLVGRHAIFRTSLDLGNFSVPLQLVFETVSVPMTVADLRHLTALDQKVALVDWVEKEKRHRFDWKVAPLMRLHVQHLSEEALQFIVSFHHVIMDGWSLATMLTELFTDYARLQKGEETPPPKYQSTYRDLVVLEQQAIQSATCQEFWKAKLHGASFCPMPRWPRSFRQGGLEQVRGPEIVVPNTVFAGLKGLANRLGVPIRTVLLAAHCRVMNYLTAQKDIVTGLVSNGRPQVRDGERVIGLFLNTLPLRLQLQGGTWAQLVLQTFQAERELIAHRRAPLSEIQKWTGGKSLFESAFDFVQFHVYQNLPGYKDHTFLEDYYFEANNFTFFVTFMLDITSTQLQMHFDYDPNELSKGQIDAFCDHYQNALGAMARSPEEEYSSRHLLTESEEHLLLKEWNNTRQHFPARACLSLLVEEQALKTPETIAVIDESEALTYRQLNEKADHLALALRGRGIQQETHVGICLSRSVHMLVGLLGVLKAGAAYLPLDPSLPVDRLHFMVQDSASPLVITDRQTGALWECSSIPSLCLNSFLESNAGADTAPSPPYKPLSSSDAAYVIYTSGSTGKPKGVKVSHRSVVNFLVSMKDLLGIQASHKVLGLTTLSFDIAALELWLPLVSGARVVIASHGTGRDPAALAKLLETQEISLMQATPITWQMLLDSGWKGIQSLTVVSGGENLPRPLANELVKRCGTVWNAYGPTETTVWSSFAKMEAAEGPVSIGRPIGNTDFYVLDEAQQPVPIGCEGELYIGGAGVALEYVNRPELTREKFVKNPWRPDPAMRVYRTGDRVKYLPTGELVFLGRIDFQVKLKGYRIELGEIESALLQHPAVRDGVVVLDSGEGTQKRLVAYWTLKQGGTPPTVEEFRAFLAGLLPDYMIPSLFLSLAELPLTPSGKVDRKRLPAPAPMRPILEKDYKAPTSPLEKELASIWKEVLKLDQVGLEDNFFSLGGESHSIVQCIWKIEARLNLPVPIRYFFDYPTIAELAQAITGQWLHSQGDNITQMLQEIEGLSEEQIKHELTKSES